MMKYRNTVAIVSLLCAPLLWANSEKLATRLDDRRLDADTQPLPIQPTSPPKQTQAAETTLPSLTKEELLNQPDLLLNALLSALLENHQDNVALLFPLYRALDTRYHDQNIDLWANAMLAKSAQQYRQAISLYRQLLSKVNLPSIRYQLAVALFEDNQSDSAEDQFQKLRAEPLSAGSLTIIEHYLAAIRAQNSWTFNGNLTYLNDPNINNAPKSGTVIRTARGEWKAQEAESAEGVGARLTVGKKWTWGNGFLNELRLESNGKYYWDNPKYNEAVGRASLGFGFRNATFSLNILPFMEQTWYAGGSNHSQTLKRFAQAGGATLEMGYWLSPKWQWNTYYEYAEQRYRERQHLNGNYHNLAASLTYFANANQYWLIGFDFNRTHTHDLDDSFLRRGIRIGWGQEWAAGFSSYIAANYAIKQYRAPFIFEQAQRNKEWSMQLSLWHKAVHFYGITPRLTYQFSKVTSNHAFYSYNKQRLFLDFTKRF